MTCENCQQRTATMDWAGTMSAMDLIHGARTARWCDACVTEAQLAYAKEQAARIPELETRLAHVRTAR